MRSVAAIPAGGLLAGAAIGLLVTDPPFLAAPLILLLSLGGAIHAAAVKRSLLLAASVSLGFFASGVLLSSVAWQRAWRPSLRVAFERIAREQRVAAEAEGRRLPEDDEAFMTVEGTLRSDAAVGDSGVSLSLWVDHLVGGQVGQVGRVRQVGREGQEGREGQDGQDGQNRQGGQVGTRGNTDRVTGGVAVTVVGALASSHIDRWLAGRRVRFPAMLHRPTRYLDPGVPDQERALARRGTTLVGTVKSGELVAIVARGGSIDESFARVRLFARHAIADAVGRWNAQSAAIVAAIVIGDRAGLDSRVETRLQEAGTYHVVAISGGNIAILAGLLLGVFRIGGWFGRGAMWCAIVVLVAYGYLVGGGASVDRATLMAVVYFGARALDHRTRAMNSIAVAATALVAVDPLSVVDPAFLLTFGATLAILLAVPIVARRRTAGAAILIMFTASAATEAMLFPIGAILFSRITFAGLGLNFLAIPLMGVAQIAGMAVLPATLVSPALAKGIGWIAHVGASGLVWSADLVRYVPFLSYRIAPPSWMVVIAYYAAGGVAWVTWRRRVAAGTSSSRHLRPVHRAAAAIAAVFALWILLDPRTLVAARGDGRLHATFIDVGQGDSIFVTFPRGSTLLVDAGGVSMASSFDIGDRVVAPVIRSAGFRRLDFVALTHGDPDHIGGAAAILAEFRPREVWEGIPVPRSAPLTALRVATEARAAKWANVYAGDHRTIDDVDVVARSPAPADWERQKVRNDDSLVLDLRWRDVSILLTGDIGRLPERAIAATLPPARLRVVKIAHHGSLTSSGADFVNAVRPQVAVVSAGRSNHFGHPTPEVLARYQAVGAEIFRTDRDGAVTVDTDGFSLDVRTYSHRSFHFQPTGSHEDTKANKATKARKE